MKEKLEFVSPAMKSAYLTAKGLYEVGAMTKEELEEIMRKTAVQKK